MSTSAWKDHQMVERALDELVARGVVSDKKQFVAVAAQFGVLLEPAKVDALGHKGKAERVYADDSRLFTCCTCSSHCVSPCYGDCDSCGAARCYNCALGGAEHSCIHGDGDDDDDDDA